MGFYQNYIRQCNKKGVSPSKAAMEAGTTKTSVNRWKNGSLPTDATIAKLANYFGCSITDLIGEENPAPTNEDGYAELIMSLCGESLENLRRVQDALAKEPEKTKAKFDLFLKTL